MAFVPLHTGISPFNTLCMRRLLNRCGKATVRTGRKVVKLIHPSHGVVQVIEVSARKLEFESNLVAKSAYRTLKVSKLDTWLCWAMGVSTITLEVEINLPGKSADEALKVLK